MIVSNEELLVALQLADKSEIELPDLLQATLTLFHETVEDACRSCIGYEPQYSTHVEYYPTRSLRRITNQVTQKSVYTRLQLRHLPVRRVTEVIVDENAYGGQAPNAFTAANDADTLVAGEGYFVNYQVPSSQIGGTNGLNAADGYDMIGQLHRIGNTWPEGAGTVKVTYVAGFTEQEFRGDGSYHQAGAIKKAIIQALVANYRQVVVQARSANNSYAGPLIAESFGDYSYNIDATLAALTEHEISLPASVQKALFKFKHFGFGL